MLAMKTLRARFKKTEVSLRPLRCMLPPNLSGCPQSLAEDPLGLRAMIPCPSGSFGSLHRTRVLPVQNSPIVPHLPQAPVCPFISSLLPPAVTMSSLSPVQAFQPPCLCLSCSSAWNALPQNCCLPNPSHPSQLGSNNTASRRSLFSPATVTT